MDFIVGRIPMANSRTIEELEAQATKFEEAAQKLREAARILAGTGTNGEISPEPRQIVHGSRMEQIVAYLRDNGPKTRAEVRAALADIPRGTIGALLNQTNFNRDSKGRWTAKGK